MNVDNLDQRISAALEARAEAVRIPVGDPALLAGRTARSRRRRATLGIATALAATAATTVLAVSLNDGGRPASEVATDPNPPMSPSSPTGNLGLHAALRQELQSDTRVIDEVLLGGVLTGAFLCGVDLLGSTTEDRSKLDVHYVWLVCGDFTTGEHAEVTTAGAIPAVVTTRRIDMGELEIVDVQYPRQSALQADIEQMFPAEIAQRILMRDVDPRPTEAELVEEASAMP